MSERSSRSYDLRAETGGAIGRDVMIGRDEEISIGAAILDQARSGLAAVVLEGEAGIGKTTVWISILDDARARGFRVLDCRTTAPEQNLSYAAIGDLLGDVDLAAVEALPGPQRHALEVVLLREEPTADSDHWRGAGVGLVTLLSGLARETPVVVAIDDVQWIDRASATILAFALRRLVRDRVALVLAARTPEQTGIPFELDRSLAGERLRTVRVPPLSLGAVYQAVKDRFGARLLRADLVRIHTASGGNPFYALELARALFEAPPTDPGAGLRLTPTLTDIVRGRIEALQPADREVLLVIALAARPSRELVEEVLGARAHEALRASIEAGLVEPEGGRLRLSHPLLASGIVATADDEGRSVHLRLAAAVPGLEERARHAAIASGGRPDEKTARRLTAAARLARARGASDSAAELASLAVALTPAARAARVERELEAAEYVFLAGDAASAGKLLRDLVERLPLGLHRARARILEARIAWEVSGSVDAVRLCEEAAADAAGDPALLGEAHAWAAEFSDFDEVKRSRHAQAAVSLLERGLPVDDQRLAAALKAFAESELVLGRGLPRDAVDRAIALQSTHRPNRVSDRVEFALGYWLVWTDALEEARERLEAAYRSSIEEGDESSLTQVTGWLRELELRAGDLARARAFADLQRESAERQGEDLWVAVARARTALVEAHTGDPDSARENASAALAVAREVGDPGLALLGEWALGLLALSLGDNEGAARWLLQADATHEAIGLVEPGYARYHADLVESLVGLGRLDEAASHLHRYEERARATNRLSAIAGAGRSRALLQGARGEGEAALASLTEARRALEPLRLPFEQGRALLVEGMVQRRLRRRGEARSSLELARDVFGSLGARLWRARAEAELARVGGRRRAPGELTDTEERVALLAAEGLKNREIAERVYLTAKSVEDVLARVYRELGIHSRAELGAWAAGRRAG